MVKRGKPSPKGWDSPRGLTSKSHIEKRKGQPKPDGWQIWGKITKKLLGKGK